MLGRSARSVMTREWRWRREISDWQDSRLEGTFCVNQKENLSFSFCPFLLRLGIRGRVSETRPIWHSYSQRSCCRDHFLGNPLTGAGGLWRPSPTRGHWASSGVSLVGIACRRAARHWRAGVGGARTASSRGAFRGRAPPHQPSLHRRRRQIGGRDVGHARRGPRRRTRTDVNGSGSAATLAQILALSLACFLFLAGEQHVKRDGFGPFPGETNLSLSKGARNTRAVVAWRGVDGHPTLLACGLKIPRFAAAARPLCCDACFRGARPGG